MPSNVSLNNGETMREAAIASLGITVLPLFIVAEALRRGEPPPWERDLPDFPQ